MATEEARPRIADPGAAQRRGRGPHRGCPARPLGILGPELEAEAGRVVVRAVLGGDEGVLERALLLTADEPSRGPLLAVGGARFAARDGDEQGLLAAIDRQV